jgi:hypothetical protein
LSDGDREALVCLAEEDERGCHVVELRYFGGLSDELGARAARV